jgi:hypothetical protein
MKGAETSMTEAIRGSRHFVGYSYSVPRPVSTEEKHRDTCISYVSWHFWYKMYVVLSIVQRVCE